MKEQFFSYLHSLVPEPEKCRFLLAVSGGMDSSAMAHLFFSCGFHFDIAHCNFHLRDNESDKDMEFVINLSLEYQCGIVIKEFFYDDFESMKGKSTEMIARDLRYRWFEELSTQYDFVVTAHHADDNAETILMNLARGTGLKGMTGIPQRNGNIIRPLLNFSSKEIAGYVGQNNITFRIDSTNLTEKYNRNKVRINIIPKLEEINPNLIATFTRNIDIFKQQYNFYSSHINTLKEQIVFKKGDQYLIPIKSLSDLPDTSLVLYEILSDFGFNTAVIDEIASSLEKNSGKRFFSNSYLLIKDRENLIIADRKKIKREAITIDHIQQLEKYGFEIEQHSKFSEMDIEKCTTVAYIDAEKLSFPLTLRRWQDGDFFYPFGMRGKKKLSDFFNDHKIDIITKQNILLLCCKEQIVWVVGYRTDNRFRIDPKSDTNYYKISYHGIL